MKAELLLRQRIVHSEDSFAEVVLWRLPKPLAGCSHAFKYRLAFVARGNCVVRIDNEAGKGDHLHVGKKETRYAFVSPEKLVADFQRQIARWQRANRDP
jgi:Family of unknown function (DUF6516)